MTEDLVQVRRDDLGRAYRTCKVIAATAENDDYVGNHHWLYGIEPDEFDTGYVAMVERLEAALTHPSSPATVLRPMSEAPRKRPILVWVNDLYREKLLPSSCKSFLMAQKSGKYRWNVFGSFVDFRDEDLDGWCELPPAPTPAKESGE